MEWLGTLASIFVFASWTVEDIRATRLINICGSVLFIIYGILTRAWSILILNTGIVMFHIFWLEKGRRNG